MKKMYTYVGRTKTGALAKGRLEATSENAVKQRLREQNISPREITETKKTIFNQELTISLNRVKTEHFVIYCRQFATLIRAGVTILDATGILADQTEGKYFKKILFEVKQDIVGGSAFSDAAEKHPKVFPALFVNMIRAGELTGNLDETLDELAVYYEKQYTLKKKVQATLAYPLILSILIVVVVIFLVTFIVPQFSGIYDQFGGELPAITKLVLAGSAFFQQFWWLMGLLLVFVILLLTFLYKSNQAFYYGTHLLILKMPIFGKMLQKTVIARMTRTLSSLFTSAVPILHSLGVVEKVVNNPVIGSVVRQAHDHLETGGTLAETLEEHWAFPPLVHQMIEIGEQTGTLDYMLEKVADFYEEEVDRSVETLQSVIEPLMIITLAVVVGFVVLAIMLPMLSILNEV